MNIHIEVIPHEQQRYETVGDWRWNEGDLTISVSNTSNWKYEALVAVHELCEVLMCKNDGVSQEDVDEFDQAYEAHRKPNDDSEPGDDPAAPYRKQHFIATNIERILAVALGVDWKRYEDTLYEL